MSKQNWTIYRYPTEEEQIIFKQLIGDAFETQALLVCCKESKGFTEYIFIYNHPTEENNNLVSFYGKVDNKKSKKSIEKALLEFATAQLTEKMILRNVSEVENLEDFPIKAKVANSIKYDIHEDADVLTSAVTENYNTSSQAKYFFDCDGKGLDANGTINPNSSKGSFCCVLQKGTEYFILTAGHNLGNGKTVGSKYKLIKDANDFVELELIKDYTNDGYDAAVLKIITLNITSTNFYKKAIKFNNNNNYYQNEKDTKEIKKENGKIVEINKTGVLVGYISRIGETFEGELDYTDTNKVKEESFRPGKFFQISQSAIGGDSGCVVFTKINNNDNKLLGIYLGDRGDKNEKGRCRPYYSLEISYKIV